jgi:NAD(P)-dependent dehydrogenase (short-subunit alcohol dehydrogenase family)
MPDLPSCADRRIPPRSRADAIFWRRKMKIRDSVVFVTGANRGLGLALARAAVERGARKVYAGMRNPTDTEMPGVIQVRLDVTDAASISAAADRCTDTTLLINNAGIARLNSSTLDSSMTALSREIFETNYYGTILVSQAFAPVIAKKWWRRDHQHPVRRCMVLASNACGVFRLEICGMELYQCVAC